MIKNILLGFGVFLVFMAVVFVWQLSVGWRAPEGSPDLAQVKIGDNVFSVEVADDIAERSRGLAHRDALPENGGMLFIFPAASVQGFWMKGMRFSLDIIWIKGNTIVGFAENLPPAGDEAPPVYYSPEPVDKVLEVAAGTVARAGIMAGEKIVIK